MRVLRAGVLGYGSMGRKHARVLAGLPGVELVAVADPVPPAEGAPPGVRWVPDLEGLLAFGLDFGVVATPAYAHLGHGRRLAEAGAAVLMEKPLAADPRQARALAGVFRAAGVVAGVGHVERYNPVVRELWRQVAGGRVGPVHQVTTVREGPFPARVRDVGVVEDLVTHDVDLAMWLAGAPHATVAARAHRRPDTGHEDAVAVTGMLANGVIVNHVANWLSPRRRRQVTVLGERGSLVADLLTGELGGERAHRISGPEPLLSELSAFADAVRGQGDEIVPPEDGLEAVAVAHAILLSAHTGHSVAVDHARLPAEALDAG